jgi:hypothetical protein
MGGLYSMSSLPHHLKAPLPSGNGTLSNLTGIGDQALKNDQWCAGSEKRKIAGQSAKTVLDALVIGIPAAEALPPP